MHHDLLVGLCSQHLLRRKQLAMIPRILWHMGNGLLSRKLSPQKPGTLLYHPAVWRSRAALIDCKFEGKLPENAYFRYMELAIWYACGYVFCMRNGHSVDWILTFCGKRT